MKRLNIALIGTPNSGKTTLFNALTGATEKVGNLCGVTVECIRGICSFSDIEFHIHDLPGLYNLIPNSPDEGIVKDALIKGRFDKIIAIIDANNIERNLFPVIQLLEFVKIPVILVFNMMDEVRKKGMMVDTETISRILKTPIVPAAVAGCEGLNEILNLLKEDLPANSFSLPVDPKIDSLMTEFSGRHQAVMEKIPHDPKWFLINFCENDHYAKKAAADSGSYGLFETFRESVEILALRDTEIYFSSARIGYIKGLLKETVVKRPARKNNGKDIHDRLDSLFIHPFLGFLIFLLAIFGLFWAVFSLGAPLQNILERLFGLLSAGAMKLSSVKGIPAGISSLLSRGIIPGIGSVIIFLPNIMIMFLLLSFLEDTGYISRAAFLMDKLMHAAGLHGKSFIPFMLGFGCNVPAILATRTLDAKKDRILTVMVMPFIACSARLPIILIFTSAFFPRHKVLVIFGLYIMSILTAFLSAVIFKRLFFRKVESDLIIELPPYRLPKPEYMFKEMWMNVREFLKKAGTIIFFSVVIIWALASFPGDVPYASETTVLGRIGHFLAGFFTPLGFGNWKAAVALVTGFVAKEQVISTLGALISSGSGDIIEHIRGLFPPASAFSFMVFSMIYTPCVATLAAIRKEIGVKWMILNAIYSVLLAYTTAFIVYQIFGRVTA